MGWNHQGHLAVGEHRFGSRSPKRSVILGDWLVRELRHLARPLEASFEDVGHSGDGNRGPGGK